VRLLLGQAPDMIVVGEAVDAKQAVALAAEQRPEVVLLEWELPGQNGSSVVADLQAARPGLMVIALSARLEARRSALAAGADGFVSKLDPPESLVAAVRECTSSKVQGQ
jgi:DNA-binding NarL/FixJ family response regulator